MHRPHGGPSGLHQGHGHAHDGEAVQVVGGAVERIHHPPPLGGRAAGLLGQDRDVGRFRRQKIPDRLFARPVHLGHVVARALGLPGQGPPGGAGHDLPAGLRGVPGDLE